MSDLTREGLAARGLRVKPLAWGYHKDPGIWTAQGVFGAFYTVSDSQWWQSGTLFTGWVSGGDDAAKAAAEADYETRILAALEQST